MKKTDHLSPTPRDRSGIVGDYDVHEGVSSAHLRCARTMIVWLPPSYRSDPDRRYPVVYMHDGQQLFDPATSTWNQDWEVDEWCTALIAEQRLPELIVVGLYSTEDRYEEYSTSGGGPAYTRFVVEEVKPFIDRSYRTLPDRAHTAVAGSSMGGGLSFYMAWTRPDIFFGAACLSPAFSHKQEPVNFDLVRNTAPLPDIRLYLYCGEADALERTLIQDLRDMKQLLAERGWTEGRTLRIVEDPAAAHNEAAWAKHTGDWLLFLFGVGTSG